MMEDNSQTNLIINYLPQTLQDEEFKTLFLSLGPVRSAKIVRDRSSGYSYGFGFVDYEKPEDAQKAVATLNGTPLQNKTIKVAFARPGSDNIKSANLYVRNIPKTMSQEELHTIFSPYGKIIQTRLLTDSYGKSKGVGFVLYDTKEEADMAINKLNGAIPAGGTDMLSVKHAEDNKGKARAPPASISSNVGTSRGGPGYGMPMRGGGMGYYGGGRGGAYGGAMSGYWGRPGATSFASTGVGGAYGRGGGPMRNQGGRFRYNPMTTGGQGQEQSQNGSSESGYILFVYNIGVDATESTLWQLFSPFGTIKKVNVIRDHVKNQCKGYGFVTMNTYEEASAAIDNLNGYLFTGAHPLQVSFKTDKD